MATTRASYSMMPPDSESWHGTVGRAIDWTFAQMDNMPLQYRIRFEADGVFVAFVFHEWHLTHADGPTISVPAPQTAAPQSDCAQRCLIAFRCSTYLVRLYARPRTSGTR